MKKNKVKIVTKSIKWIVLVVSLIYSARYISNNYYQLVLIQGNSMKPTYHHLQLVILEKQEKEYAYNDVIAFWCEGLDAYLVKRIVACPGDSVYIGEGVLYVNGHINEYYQEINFDFSGIVEKEIVLSSKEYFVLGDNVAFSKDSRYIEVGLVNEDSILGKVLK